MKFFLLVENMLDVDLGNKVSGKDKIIYNDLVFNIDKFVKLENRIDFISQEDFDVDGLRVNFLFCFLLKFEDSDCCGLGCVFCVFDIYEQDLKIWKQECRKI